MLRRVVSWLEEFFFEPKRNECGMRIYDGVSKVLGHAVVALVNNRYVVTATHCVVREVEKKEKTLYFKSIKYGLTF